MTVEQLLTSTLTKTGIVICWDMSRNGARGCQILVESSSAHRKRKRDKERGHTHGSVEPASQCPHELSLRQQCPMQSQSEQNRLRPASLAEAQEELSRSLLAGNEYSLVRVLADGGSHNSSFNTSHHHTSGLLYEFGTGSILHIAQGKQKLKALVNTS